MKYEEVSKYSNRQFQKATSLRRVTFKKMVEILRKGYAEKHRRRGRAPKLSIEDLLLATLEYLLTDITYAQLAANHGIAESNIYRGIQWVMDTLNQDGTFPLGRTERIYSIDMTYEVILVDATGKSIY